MKRLVTTAILLLLSASLALASDNYEVTYRRTAPDIQELTFSLVNYDIGIREFQGETFSVIDFGSSVVTRLAGYAEVPFVHATVMIDRIRNVNMVVTPGEYKEIRLEKPLKPSRGVIYRTQDPSAIPYSIDPQSLTDSWYPGNTAGLTDPFILRDIRGVNVYIYPFQYNAEKQVLRVYTSVRVQLYQNNTVPENPLLKEISPVVREMDAIYRSVFINYPDNSGSREALTVGSYGDILVITTARDEQAIAPYVDWKREKGYDVSVEVVPPATLVNPIVQDAYNENNDLLYVQLVGDWADLKSETLNFGAPMDPQVGCVVGNDDFADVCIGRISGNSAGDVTVQVNKVVSYERDPEIGGVWYSTATGIASNEGNGIGDDGESDWQHNDVIWEDKLDPFTFDDYNPIYDPGASGGQVTAAVNAGTSLINYTGHGSANSWGTTGFSSSQVNNLGNGSMLPWIISVACNNGDFHTGTCFAESWLRKDGGGAVAMLAASISQPWAPPMRGQDYFMDIVIGGYDYNQHSGQSGITTTEQRTTVGTIVFNGLTLMTTESYGYDDWETAKTWNLFGDPSLQVRTLAPTELSLSNELIMSGIPFSTTITSSGGPVAGAMVCLSQGGNYFSGITDSNGVASIEQGLVPGNALMVVSAFNTETIYDTVPVIPPDGPYVVFDTLFINDAQGNGNALLDYAEPAFLSIGLKNIGEGDANNVNAALSIADSHIALTDSLEFYGNISAGQTVFIDNAFGIEASGSLPDLHLLNFNLEVESDGSDEAWSSGFSITGHAAVISYGGYVVSDAEGNGNGRLDPGETAEMAIYVMNTGTSEAFNVAGTLETTSEYVSLESGSATYGNAGAGDTAMLVYTVTADASSPEGHSAVFTFDATADYGLALEKEFYAVVGQIPVLVIDRDGNSTAPHPMIACLENLGVGADYATSLPGEDLAAYSCVFVCLGTYPENHILSADEGAVLAGYLEQGGYLYMEGGDTWYYDQTSSPTPVHPMFKIKGLADGNGDLSTIIGLDGTLAEGIYLHYEGDNGYIDHLDTIGAAKSFFLNGNPQYYCAVSYDAGDYRTIGTSFEFGGLTDEEFTRDDYMIRILEFFDIPGVWTSTGREAGETPVLSLNVAPNPLSGQARIEISLEQPSPVVLDVYAVNGRRVGRLLDGYLEKGTHSIPWEGIGVEGRELPSGMYFLRLNSGNSSVGTKVVIAR